MSQPDPIWPRPQLTIPRGPTAGLRWRLDLDWRIDWGGPDWNAGDLDWGMAPRRITMRSPIVQILLAGYELPQAPPPPEAPPWWLDTRANWWHRDAPPKKPKAAAKSETARSETTRSEAGGLRAPGATPNRDTAPNRTLLAADRDGFGAGLRAGKPLPMSSRRPEVLVGGPETPPTQSAAAAVPRSLHAAARSLTPDPESRRPQVSLRPPPATRAPTPPAPSGNSPRPTPRAEAKPADLRPPTPSRIAPSSATPPTATTRPPASRPSVSNLDGSPRSGTTAAPERPPASRPVTGPPGHKDSPNAPAPTPLGSPPNAGQAKAEPGQPTPTTERLSASSAQPPRAAPLEPPAGWGGLRSPFSAALHPRVEAQDLALAWGAGGQPKTLRSNAPQVMVSAEAPAPEPTARPPLRPAWPPLPPPGSGLPGGWGQKKPTATQSTVKTPTKKPGTSGRDGQGREVESRPAPARSPRAPESRLAETKPAAPRSSETRQAEARSAETRPGTHRPTDPRAPAPPEAPTAVARPTAAQGPTTGPSDRSHRDNNPTATPAGSGSPTPSPTAARPSPRGPASPPVTPPETSAANRGSPASATSGTPSPTARSQTRPPEPTAELDFPAPSPNRTPEQAAPTARVIQPEAAPTPTAGRHAAGEDGTEAGQRIRPSTSASAEAPPPTEPISWRAPAQERGRAHRPLLSAGGPEAWTDVGATAWRGTSSRPGGSADGGAALLDGTAPTWGTAQRKFVRLRGLNAQPVLLGAPAAAATPVVEDARGQRIPITPWPERAPNVRPERSVPGETGSSRPNTRPARVDTRPPEPEAKWGFPQVGSVPPDRSAPSGSLRTPAPVLSPPTGSPRDAGPRRAEERAPTEAQEKRPITESALPAGATHRWPDGGHAGTGRALDLRSPSPFHRVTPRSARAPGGVVQADLGADALAWGPDQRRFTRGNLGAPRVLLGAPEAPDLSRPGPESSRGASARGMAIEPWPDRGSPWERSRMATRPTARGPEGRLTGSPTSASAQGIGPTAASSPTGPRRSWRNDPRGETPTLRAAWSQGAPPPPGTGTAPRGQGGEASGQRPSPFVRSPGTSTPGGSPRETQAPTWGPDQRSFVRGRLSTGPTPYLSAQGSPPPPSEGAWSEPILRDPTGRTIRTSPFGGPRSESARLRAPTLPGSTRKGQPEGPSGQPASTATAPNAPTWRGKPAGSPATPERSPGSTGHASSESAQASPQWGRRKLTQAASHRPMTLVDAREDATPPEAPVWRSPSWWERSRAGSPEVERWARAAGDRPGVVRNIRTPQANRAQARAQPAEAPSSSTTPTVDLGGIRGRRRTLAAPIGAGVRWLDAPGFGTPPPPPKPPPPVPAKPPAPPPPAAKPPPPKPPPPPPAWEAPKGRNEAPSSPTNKSRRPPPPKSGRPPNLPPWDPNKVPDRPPFPTEDEIKSGPGPSRAPFPQEGEDGWIPDGAAPRSDGSPAAPPPQWNAPGFTPPPGAPNPSGSSTTPPGVNPPSDRSFTHIAPAASGSNDGIVDNELESTPGGPARKRAATAASPPGINTLTERQMYQVIVELAHGNPAVRRLLLEIQDEVQSLIELDRSRRF